MDVSLSFDTLGFNSEMTRFIEETGREAGEVIRDQARLFVRDLIAATPPFGGHTFDRRQESFNDQRRIGRARVEKDIRKKFISLRQFIDERVHNQEIKEALAAAGGLGVSKKTGKGTFSKRRANPEAVALILKNMGIDMKVMVLPDPADHQRARTRKGRVNRPRQVIVLQDRALDRYVRQVQEHVGKSKAGWLQAALALGVKGIPAWISAHVTPGLIEDESAKELEPSITIGNLVPWGADFDRGPIDAAAANRIVSMRTQLEKLMENAARKRRARVLAAA